MCWQRRRLPGGILSAHSGSRPQNLVFIGATECGKLRGLVGQPLERARDAWQEAKRGDTPMQRNKEVASMTISPHPDSIRDIVFRTFLELDVPEGHLTDLDERIMLDDGRYVARSYRVDEFLAMWLIDVGLVQFYDGAGNMLRTVNLFEEIQPHRMAA
jgi:hypothetical protein